jgi:hypothetical protein
MRFIIIAAVAILPAACASGPHYDPETFDRVSSANPIDRGTEMLRQIRHAEIERDKQRANETKETPRLFKSQKDGEEDET